MIVTHIAIEPSNISNKLFPIIFTNPGFKDSLLKFKEITFLKICLEKQKKERRFITNLVKDHLGPSP
jgi:hypothetical protein